MFVKEIITAVDLILFQGECETFECIPAEWSAWSSQCGKASRQRIINSVQKTVKHYSCDGLKTTCDKDVEKEERNEKCTCSYVDCEMGEWSEWSSECGDASRTRPITALLKTVRKYSCDGLQQSCDKKEDVEERATQCKETPFNLLLIFYIAIVSILNIPFNKQVLQKLKYNFFG